MTALNVRPVYVRSMWPLLGYGVRLRAVFEVENLMWMPLYVVQMAVVCPVMSGARR